MSAWSSSDGGTRPALQPTLDMDAGGQVTALAYVPARGGRRLLAALVATEGRLHVRILDLQAPQEGGGGAAVLRDIDHCGWNGWTSVRDTAAVVVAKRGSSGGSSSAASLVVAAGRRPLRVVPLEYLPGLPPPPPPSDAVPLAGQLSAAPTPLPVAPRAASMSAQARSTVVWVSGPAIQGSAAADAAAPKTKKKKTARERATTWAPGVFADPPPPAVHTPRLIVSATVDAAGAAGNGRRRTLARAGAYAASEPRVRLCSALGLGDAISASAMCFASVHHVGRPAELPVPACFSADADAVVPIGASAAPSEHYYRGIPGHEVVLHELPTGVARRGLDCRGVALHSRFSPCGRYLVTVVDPDEPRPKPNTNTNGYRPASPWVHADGGKSHAAALFHRPCEAVVHAAADGVVGRRRGIVCRTSHSAFAAASAVAVDAGTGDVVVASGSFTAAAVALRRATPAGTVLAREVDVGGAAGADAGVLALDLAQDGEAWLACVGRLEINGAEQLARFGRLVNTDQRPFVSSRHYHLVFGTTAPGSPSAPPPPPPLRLGWPDSPLPTASFLPGGSVRVVASTANGLLLVDATVGAPLRIVGDASCAHLPGVAPPPVAMASPAAIAIPASAYGNRGSSWYRYVGRFPPPLPLARRFVGRWSHHLFFHSFLLLTPPGAYLICFPSRVELADVSNAGPDARTVHRWLASHHDPAAAFGSLLAAHPMASVAVDSAGATLFHRVAAQDDTRLLGALLSTSGSAVLASMRPDANGLSALDIALASQRNDVIVPLVDALMAAAAAVEPSAAAYYLERLGAALPALIRSDASIAANALRMLPLTDRGCHLASRGVADEWRAGRTPVAVAPSQLLEIGLRPAGGGVDAPPVDPLAPTRRAGVFAACDVEAVAAPPLGAAAGRKAGSPSSSARIASSRGVGLGLARDYSSRLGLGGDGTSRLLVKAAVKTAPFPRLISLELLDELARCGDPEILKSETVGLVVRCAWFFFAKPRFIAAARGYGWLLATFFGYTLAVGRQRGDESLAALAASPAGACSLLLDLVLLAIAAASLRREYTQALRRGVRQYACDAYNALDICSALSIVATAAVHLARGRAFPVAAAVTAVLVWLNGLFYLRGFKTTGVFVRMVERVLADMRVFLAVLLLVLWAFANAFFLLGLSGHDGHVLGSLYQTLLLSVVADLGPEDLAESHNYPVAAALYLVFLTLVVVVMLNLLIAIMADTYSRVRGNAGDEFLRLRLGMVLEVLGAADDADLERFDRLCAAPWVCALVAPSGGGSRGGAEGEGERTATAAELQRMGARIEELAGLLRGGSGREGMVLLAAAGGEAGFREVAVEALGEESWSEDGLPVAADNSANDGAGIGAGPGSVRLSTDTI